MRRLERGLAGALILLGLVHGVAGLLAASLEPPELQLWFTVGAIVPILTGLLVIERTRLPTADAFLRMIITLGLVSFIAACVTVAIGWRAWRAPQIVAFLAVQLPLVWLTWRPAPAARAAARGPTARVPRRSPSRRSTPSRA